MTSMTRRAALQATGTAAVALLASGTIANGADPLAECDPIYPAIEAHAAAQAKIDRFCARVEEEERPDDDETLGTLGGEETRRLWAILHTEPTTIAGVAAALAHFEDYRWHGRQAPERAMIPERDLAPEEHRYDWAGMGVAFEQDAIAWAARNLQRLGGGNA